MMFSNLVTFTAVLALPILAVATPVVVARQSSTATTVCCTSTATAASPLIALLLGLLGLSDENIVGVVGIGCTPLPVVGVASGLCNANTLECTNVVGGGIGFNCVPVLP
ncbi:hydrophobin, mutated [Phlebiopsis gigantea 11061_1 CR5-6]|uniref:Hydrophobin n=1 Tax=Phlebiopsis gigantea (strain 11061_1 CR5-6) TaxID=745531 RepID=A0A0C3S4F2_PHLG1|nr:hydrophobin, mutated [Phlebiopsis gigantea 11061_1 CR5-6]